MPCAQIRQRTSEEEWPIRAIEKVVLRINGGLRNYLSKFLREQVAEEVEVQLEGSAE